MDQAPPPQTVEESLQRQLNLTNKAKSHSIILFNYLQNKKNNEICMIPPMRTCPPLVPNTYPMCRYTNEEWDNAVLYEMKLLEDNNKLLEKNE